MITMQAFNHVRNMRAKGLEPMFCDFISNLPLQYKPLLAPVNNFQDLNKVVTALRKDSSFHDALEPASKPFCDTYEAEFGFWKQYGELESINTDRSKVVHCSVSDSAAHLTEACDDIDALDSALAMAEALANYCAKHAADLDASAEKQRKECLALTERIKQKRKRKLLQK